MNTPKPYRLCKDIQNPQYDKRCTSGHRSFAVFKAGTFFVGYPASWADGKIFSCAYVCSKEWSYLHNDIAALILDNSEETQPLTWHEIASIGGSWHHLASDVLETLINTGAIGLDQVTLALNICIRDKT